MNIKDELINRAKTWTGYLEKSSNKDLDNFTANAGRNNYTCFARDYYKHTGINCQAQPWCAMFVSEVFVQQFGLEEAKKMLGNALYHYCPTGVNQFKAAGRWYKYPEPGDVIFFTNSIRAYHTGIVTEVTSSRVNTIEGNTSGASGVIANGGGVCQKSYSLVDKKIMGYGRPEWNVVQPKYNMGWNHDQNGWWYAFSQKEYYKSCWQVINGHKYYFNSDGYAVTNWQVIDGKWYYFEPIPGTPLECALYTTNQDGVQAVGEF